MSPKPKHALIFAAVLPAAMVPIAMPALRAFNTPNYIVGFVMGVLLGLSLVGMIVMVRRGPRCVG